MSKTIQDTNSVNKTVQGYTAPVKEKQRKPDPDSAPNYRSLTMTPKKAQADILASRAHFGQSIKDLNQTKRTIVPPKVSNRPALAREKGQKEPMQPKQEQPPLKSVQPKPRIQATTKSTGGEHETKPFRSFDFPLSARELNQLRLEQLKGTDQKTQELLTPHFTIKESCAPDITSTTTTSCSCSSNKTRTRITSS
jgi:hypothetical protein